MAAKPNLKLFGNWASSYVHRVQLALKLKGIEYEYVEEDLGNKSPDLLQYNPIYAKVPVLLHHNRPIVESYIILEYIDEVWSDAYALFPKDPYERALVRFWHHFQVDKVAPAIQKMFFTVGEEQKAAVQEFRQLLKVSEDEMREGLFKGRRFFGGDQIGALDIICGVGSVWFLVLEEIAGTKIIDPETFPCLWAWFNDFNELEHVKEIVPAKEKLLEQANAYRAAILPTLAGKV